MDDIETGLASKKIVLFSPVIIALVDALFVVGSGLLILTQLLSKEVTLFHLFLTSIYACITVFCFYNFKLYHFQSIVQPRTKTKVIILLQLILFSFVLMLAFVFKLTDQLSRDGMITWFLSTVALMILIRYFYYFALQKWGEEGKFSRNIVVIGAELHGQRLLEIIDHQKKPWMHIVGVFEDRFSRVPTKIGENPVLGTVNDLIDYAQQHRVDDVIIALPWVAEKRIQEIIKKLDVLPANIHLSPDMLGFNFIDHSFSEYCGLPVLNISDKAI